MPRALTPPLNMSLSLMRPTSIRSPHSDVQNPHALSLLLFLLSYNLHSVFIISRKLLRICSNISSMVLWYEQNMILSMPFYYVKYLIRPHSHLLRFFSGIENLQKHFGQLLRLEISTILVNNLCFNSF